jgi:hypothetical protein
MFLLLLDLLMVEVFIMVMLRQQILAMDGFGLIDKVLCTCIWNPVSGHKLERTGNVYS